MLCEYFDIRTRRTVNTTYYRRLVKILLQSNKKKEYCMVLVGNENLQHSLLSGLQFVPEL